MAEECFAELATLLDRDACSPTTIANILGNDVVVVLLDAPSVVAGSTDEHGHKIVVHFLAQVGMFTVELQVFARELALLFEDIVQVRATADCPVIGELWRAVYPRIEVMSLLNTPPCEV